MWTVVTAGRTIIIVERLLHQVGICTRLLWVMFVAGDNGCCVRHQMATWRWRWSTAWWGWVSRRPRSTSTPCCVRRRAASADDRQGAPTSSLRRWPPGGAMSRIVSSVAGLTWLWGMKCRTASSKLQQIKSGDGQHRWRYVTLAMSNHCCRIISLTHCSASTSVMTLWWRLVAEVVCYSGCVSHRTLSSIRCTVSLQRRFIWTMHALNHRTLLIILSLITDNSVLTDWRLFSKHNWQFSPHRLKCSVSNDWFSNGGRRCQNDRPRVVWCRIYLTLI